jgi:serine/threonine-protein kinase
MLDRTVAIKTISLSLSKEEIAEFEQRFYREAKSAGRLNHPNIVTIYDIGRTDTLAYLAMEFLEGRSLREILDDGAVLPVERIADIAAQVADGLQAAHDAQVVHRDIKPANIMILANGTAKITDFGVALIPSANRTQAGTILGSPKYMSPEQVVGQDLDGRSDIFSLGVMLYEMLTGKAPFTGENINAIMFKIINESPLSPTAVKTDIPPVFDAIVARAMAKHPDDRYRTARDLASDLRNFRHLQLEVPAKLHGNLERRAVRRVDEEDDGDKTVFTGSPVSQPAQTPPPPRQHRTMGRALLALGVLLFAGGIGLIFHAKSKSGAPMEPMSQVAAEKIPAPQAEAPPKTTASIEDGASQAKKPPAPAREQAASPQARKGESVKTTGTGTLELWISPWGDVYVDNKKVGTSPPLRSLPLPAGKHHIEIRSIEGFPYIATHEIKAGETTRINKTFP